MINVRLASDTDRIVKAYDQTLKVRCAVIAAALLPGLMWLSGCKHISVDESQPRESDGGRM